MNTLPMPVRRANAASAVDGIRRAFLLHVDA
jgi:hypothetical protein